MYLVLFWLLILDQNQYESSKSSKCHRSYLINLKYVDELVKNDGDYLLLNNQKRIPISKSKRDQFLDVIKETFM